MTSFLNKKFSLILVILATLIIATSIASATAATNVTATFPGNNTTVDASLNQTLIINGSISNNALPAGNQKLSGNIVLYFWNATGSVLAPVDGSKYNLSVNTTITSSSSYKFSFNLNTLDLYNLGATSMGIEFVPDANSDVPTGWSPGLDSMNIPLIVNMKPKLTIEFDTNPKDLKVGQQANITGTVYGPGEFTPFTKKGIGFLDLNYTLPNGTVVPITTDADGKFVITGFPVTALNFNIAVLTAVAGANAAIYTDANTTHAFTAGPGLVEAQVWWNTNVAGPAGYLVGNNSTVYWNLTNYEHVAGQNVLAWLVLFDYDNPNVDLRKMVVKLYDPQTVNGVQCDGYLNLTPFILPHDKLMARLVINGMDLTTMQQLYSQSYGEDDTFVFLNNSKPVRIGNYSATLKNLTVGVKNTMVIPVNDAWGNPVASGMVKIVWDGKWNFTAEVINGVATWEHIFTKAQANRVVEVSYIANPDLNLSKSPVRKEIAPVYQGQPVLTVTQFPINAAFVGEKVTIMTLIYNFVGSAADAPKTITLKFMSGTTVVHKATVSIVPDAAVGSLPSTIASATFEYAYKKTHTTLNIVAEIVDPKNNYKNATSPPLVVTVA